MALMAKWSCHRLWHHVTYVSVVSSTLACLSFYIGLICPYRAHGEWNYTSRFSPMIIWQKFNWEFDMQPVYLQTFRHLIWVISPTIGLNSHVKIQLVWVLQWNFPDVVLCLAGNLAIFLFLGCIVISPSLQLSLSPGILRLWNLCSYDVH